MGNLKNLYFFSQDIVLKRQSNQLAVYKDGKKHSAFPLSTFNSIFIYGKVEIKASLINFLLDNGKYIVFLNSKGIYRGFLFNRYTQSNNSKRLRQYEIYFSKEEKLNFAKQLIFTKISKIESIFNLNLKNKKIAFKKAKSFDTLLGIEGAASTLMFDKFKHLLVELKINFEGRSYKPPKDEINALLSSFYTAFHNRLIPEIYMEGLDPFLGLLHVKRGTHHALVSDFMEIIRPDITFLVYQFLKEHPINELNFEKYKEGFYLSFESLKVIHTWLVSNHMEKHIKFVKSYIENSFCI